MSTAALPFPVRRAGPGGAPPAPGTPDDGELGRRLRAAGLDADTGSRRLAEYAYDASNYRVRPRAVVFPRSAADVAAALSVCRDLDVPVTSRGGGTSMAGNAVGPGLVLDLSRHLRRIGTVDEDALTVDVEAGAVLSVLAREVERRTDGRRTFAPDPSSRTRATVGGSVGNDACGNHSVRYGRTSDHTVELDLVTADGALLTAGPGGLRATDPADEVSARRAGELAGALQEVAAAHLAELRVELGRIPRQVSGYHLQHLLPERGFDVARALVGSEGTLAVVVGARMRLVPRPRSALLLCLGYEDVVAAARDVPILLEEEPAAVEGIDDKIVATMRWRRGADAVAAMPRGGAWLYVDLDGDDAAEVAQRAEALLERLLREGHALDGRTVPDPVERTSLWRVREDGAGLSSRLAPDAALERSESWPGWEDSAVAPERLAGYLAELRALLGEHGLDGVVYGHFGAGCLHIRITYDLRSEEGRAVFRAFTQDAARLVVAHGGSLSGEHGDGRARSELLGLMYSPRVLGAFAAVKRAWDPHGLLNPGVLVDPAALTADLALEGVPQRQWRTSFPLGELRAGEDRQDPFVHAVQGCIGVGRCRADTGGVMCPSYRATLDERDSTRGRARVLQEMVRSAPDQETGWRSRDVREVLDLCLSCKACATDCPAGVDMATYKSEFFDHFYRGRLRPFSHYSLGRLPRWLGLTGRFARLLNAALRDRPATRPLLRAGMRAAGLAPERPLPRFAGAADWIRQVAAAGVARPGAGTGETVLFVDSFTRGFRPEVAGAAARVLAGSGRPVECAPDACCALTWISTGQLGTAQKVLRRTVAALDDGSARPVVVVEPSCAAALRHDLPGLVPTDAARRVAARVRSFAEHVTELARDGALPAPGTPLPPSVVVQTHCHEYSAFGAATQRRALAAAGVGEVREATGCCGVAGNFGFEAAHYEVSLAVAEQALAPALRETEDSVPVLTDGFSCHEQVRHLRPDRPGRHLAQLLDPRPADPAGPRTDPDRKDTP
ncbi:FAD-binding and (Fe-S)-binding domain-containing protein [Kocuria rosea]|uniref:FAD-binding and (Fe-S)-binding domain-containing protein n=1 Tax=Kocuria rosea TaxID=1275 RepID=UPI0009E94777|nr:FAD-binding and (Fe-S)-binding domain-containing protein [Kocuria polaris]